MMVLEGTRKRRLLTDLNKLTHSERVRHMALLGRDEALSPSLRKLLDRLDGDLHEWQLRLYAAQAARDSSDIMAGLQSPLRSVRSLALTFLPMVPLDPALVFGALESLPAAERKALFAVVRKTRNRDLADELMQQVFETFGAQQAANLLPGCSTDVTAQWLGRVAHATINWATLASSHPELFARFIRQQMQDLPVLRDEWWARAEAGLSELVEHDPETLISLWEDFGPADGLPNAIIRNLSKLARHNPDRTVNALLRPQSRRQVPHFVRRVRRSIPKLSPNVVGDLAKAMVDHHRALAVVLNAIAPSKRVEVFSQATSGVDTSQTRWDGPLLSVLPHDVRATEVTRMLALPQVRDNDLARQDLLVALRIEESWDELRAATTASDADLRGDAYARLVKASLGARDPVVFGRLLDELQRLRNEQDPVRARALAVLPECSPGLVKIGHFGQISNLVQFVAEARDSSWQSINPLSKFLQRIVLHAATPQDLPRLMAAVDCLSILAGPMGTLSLGQLRNGLPKGGAQLLFDALEHRIRNDLDAGRVDLLFSLANSLGPRAYEVAGLQAMIGETCQSKDLGHARRAIALWLSVPGGKAEKLGELVQWDPSVALVHPVFWLLGLVRQDLLDEVLTAKARSGRFAPGKKSQLPMADSGFYRWNPDQRQEYGQLLSAAIDNEPIGYVRISAIRSLGRIPEAGSDSLRRLVDSSDVVSTEAALSALSWSERPGESLGLLLSYADSDRARVAVYSASRAARFAMPTEVDSALSQLLDGDDAKLTSRKEALRILGRDRTPGALGTFAEVWAGRPLHRDLTIALASALRSYPDVELSWEVLAEMAAGQADTALAVVQMAPTPLVWPEEYRGRLSNLLVPLVGHESRAVRIAMWANIAAWRPWDEQVPGLVTGAISNLDTVSEWRHAVGSLHRLVDNFPVDNAMTATVEALLRQPEPEGSDAGAERDRPISQRLGVLSSFEPQTGAGRAAMRAAGGLLARGGYAPESIRFLSASTDWARPEDALGQIVAVAEVHPEATPTLHRAVSSLLQDGLRAGRWLPSGLLDSATTFVAGNEASALVAAAIVTEAGSASGWSPQWRELLRHLRRHPSVWVRDAASSFRTAGE